MAEDTSVGFGGSQTTAGWPVEFLPCPPLSLATFRMEQSGTRNSCSLLNEQCVFCGQSSSTADCLGRVGAADVVEAAGREEECPWRSLLAPGLVTPSPGGLVTMSRSRHSESDLADTTAVTVEACG